MRRVHRLSLLALALCGLLPARPLRAHQGPPFPIVEDRRVGPYVASVWTDPDIGNGTFYVILEAAPGRDLPSRTGVRIGVQPTSGRPAEALYDAAPQAVRQGARYFTTVPFAHGGMWRVRVLLDGPQGGGTLTAEVEATPDGTIGPIGLVVYLLPFLAIGFLWLKAARSRKVSK